jgi:hypothetical protein
LFLIGLEFIGSARSGEIPLSLEETVLPLPKVELKVMPSLDNKALLERDSLVDRPTGPVQFAESIKVSFNPDSVGTWEN